MKSGMRRWALAALACVLTACISSGPRDVQRYYLLEDSSSSNTKAEAGRKATLLLAPTTVIEPALAPKITRKLLHVIPANLQIDARWDAIRKTRDAADV